MVNGMPLIDDSSWGPEADYLETGHVIPFGSINIFVGFIGGRSISLVQEGDSVEEEHRRLDQINQGIQQERQRVAALAATQRQVDS